MTRRLPHGLRVFFILFLIGVARAAPSAPLYRIEEIGLSDAYPSSSDLAGHGPRINDLGQDVYVTRSAPMLYTDGKGLEALSISGSVSDINNRGQIVGVTIWDGRYFAYRFSEGARIDALVPLVGTVNIGEHGYLYTDGEGVKTLPYRFTRDINNRGDILASNAEAHPLFATGRYLYTETGGREDIRARYFDRGGGSVLNDRGQVAGFRLTDSSPTSVVMVDIETGVSHDLGTFSNSRQWLSDLNNHGQAVGVFTGWPPGYSFIASEATGCLDLNTLIDPTLGWSLAQATGINEAGQIVGYGELNGESRVFRLTPTAIPEPGTLALLAMGLLPLARRRKTWDSRLEG